MSVAGKVQPCPKEVPGYLGAGPRSGSIRNYRGLVRGMLPCTHPYSLFSAWTQSPEPASREGILWDLIPIVLYLALEGSVFKPWKGPRDNEKQRQRVGETRGQFLGGEGEQEGP